MTIRKLDKAEEARVRQQIATNEIKEELKRQEELSKQATKLNMAREAGMAFRQALRDAVWAEGLGKVEMAKFADEVWKFANRISNWAYEAGHAQSLAVFEASRKLDEMQARFETWAAMPVCLECDVELDAEDAALARCLACRTVKAPELYPNEENDDDGAS